MSERSVEFDFRASANGSVIKIDGVPVKGVRGATITMRVGEPTTVQLELVGKSVSGVGLAAENVYVDVTDCDSETREYLPA